MELIGRHRERKILDKLVNSKRAEFAAIYGRRRVGKTYLIRKHLEKEMSFQYTGMANAKVAQQLIQFHNEMQRQFSNFPYEMPLAKDWFEAFRQLVQLIEMNRKSSKIIVFIDELPWISSRRSGFMSAFEYFWNSWASKRNDILLIVCGSAASWMLNKVINNKGGLHNRITEVIKLDPFSLSEVEQFFAAQNAKFDHYQLVLLYLVFGGIPYYLEKIDCSMSADQNINNLCFQRNALFRYEFDKVFASLFEKSEKHVEIIEALAKKKKGLTRSEILKYTRLSNGGGLTRTLKELEESNFIRRYKSIGKKERNSLYQLIDPYSLFYLNFIKYSNPEDENFWINSLESPSYRAWSGYAFELVCLLHVQEIKSALGIAGVQTKVASWSSPKTQIDLLIDRKDQVITLCEMKFSIHPFAINKKYAENLRNKIGEFRGNTKTRKAIYLATITTFGLAHNTYSGMVQNDLNMEVFFRAPL